VSPDADRLRKLLDWSPALGVISVCVEIDPADRGEGWRVALRDELERVVQEARGSQDRELRLAVEATAGRILEHLGGEAPARSGRCRLGFVEVARNAAEERWETHQIRPRGTHAVRRARPDPTPLAELLHDGAPILVAAVSSERVRLWRWELGRATEVAGWEADFDADQWRERRARVSRDPASAQFPKAAGRDQFAQRLAANRERFLREAGKRLRDESGTGLRATVAFGDPELVAQVVAGAGNELDIRQVGGQDIVSEEAERIAARIEAVHEQLQRDYELERARRAIELTAAGAQAALGLQETVQALSEARVAELILDPERPADAAALVLPDWARAGGGLAAAMIEQALRTGATVTPVRDEASDALANSDRVAALLRF
jgi:hypothetical protein